MAESFHIKVVCLVSYIRQGCFVLLILASEVKSQLGKEYSFSVMYGIRVGSALGCGNVLCWQTANVVSHSKIVMFRNILDKIFPLPVHSSMRPNYAIVSCMHSLL